MHKRLLPVSRYRQQDRSLHGFPTQMLKYFRKDFRLDAYKGYHQVQMAEEDEEQTAFYTDQGTYCYTKMSFGLKNMVATYQRKGRKCFLKAQEDGPGPTDSNESPLKRNLICISSDIKRSSKCSTVSGKAGKATPNALYSGRLYKRGIGGNEVMTPRQTRYTIDHQKYCKEEWVLYTDGASSAKGSGAGLVLISPTKIEYTYALRLNFKSTNNEAEYEALLTGLRMAKKMRVQSLFVNVDSKLVASQINKNYEACKENMI
nr:putative ribonuclease H-like domain-containing protein [Tanacetum cinerariifolium]